MQEANKLVPNVAGTLCLAAKASSDACYLDEIQGPFRERLTMQDRHEVNKKAIEYAKQVLTFFKFMLTLTAIGLQTDHVCALEHGPARITVSDLT